MFGCEKRVGRGGERAHLSKVVHLAIVLEAVEHVHAGETHA